MDYNKLANNYKPNIIKILLIGEAPPPNGKSYFYYPDNYRKSAHSIEMDRSLPATIFNHFFNARPESVSEYEQYLCLLKEKGIFLIDIIDEPLQIRDGNNINTENLEKLLSEENLDELNSRIFSLSQPDTEIIFLLARNSYTKRLRDKFGKNVKYIKWKDFRMDTQLHNG